MIALVAFVAKNGKDCDGCVQRRDEIRRRQYEHIAFDIVFRRIVRGERDQTAERQAHRVEDLRRCIEPHTRIEQLRHLKHASSCIIVAL